jgi:hypothetical protein
MYLDLIIIYGYQVSRCDSYTLTRVGNLSNPEFFFCSRALSC